MRVRVLIVEDESLIRWSLRQKFEERGYVVTEAENGADAEQALDGAIFDLVMLDYKLPDTTGLEIIRRMRESDNDTVVIMMTAYSTIESAVEAIRLGAFDYVPKPFQMEELLFTVDKALETTKLRREVRELRRHLEEKYGTDTIIGQHASMRSLMEMIQQVAGIGSSTVLLRGETGTGKDLVARVIHHCSERTAQPFINITCTALAESLLESELFGHERGAFTDAKAQKKGLLEAADRGTVFLDEIGDMQPALQAKLLRFLEERCFRRVGGTKEISVDVRVIAATNRDIEQAIVDRKFRADLFYRLNVVTFNLPPLRERGEDVILLAKHFLESMIREFKKDISGMDERAYQRLRDYDWPGNVRELRNVIERAVLLCNGSRIQPEDIVIGRPGPLGAQSDIDGFVLPSDGLDFGKLGELEARMLREAMERTDHNQTQAAKMLKLSRDRLRYRLQKHGLL